MDDYKPKNDKSKTLNSLIAFIVPIFLSTTFYLPLISCREVDTDRVLEQRNLSRVRSAVVEKIKAEDPDYDLSDSIFEYDKNNNCPRKNKDEEYISDEPIKVIVKTPLGSNLNTYLMKKFCAHTYQVPHYENRAFAIEMEYLDRFVDGVDNF